MLRFAAGAGSALLLMLGGFFIWQSAAQSDTSLTAPDFVAPEFAAEEEESGSSAPDEAGPAVPPAADARTKEQRRFDRADKDKNGAVALEELYMPRRKAFARLDTTAAVAILKEDDLIDKEFDGFVRKLITYMMEDPRTISASLDLLFLAKSIERIGDHAKNIAEFIIYVVKGADVRHTSMDAIESVVR